MIVIFTEEASMRECLKVIIPKLWPNSVEGSDWMVLAFQGKSDLEKSFPKKMRRWNYGNPHFVILRDNDGGDCFVLKQKLCDIAKPYQKPFSVVGTGPRAVLAPSGEATRCTPFLFIFSIWRSLWNE